MTIKQKDTIGQLHHIPAHGNKNYRVPLEFYSTIPSQQVLIVLPAMGIAARFYRPLAKQLCDCGVNVILFEQRGHGNSSIRASRKSDYGFKEYLTEDLPAVITWIKKRIPNSQINLMGHSLGGHMASCYTGMNPHEIDRVILSACSIPHYTAYNDGKRWQTQLLYLLIPMAHWIYGYFPGHVFKFAGREARSLVNDWRHLIHNPTYQASGIECDIDKGVGQFSGPVLSISFDADNLSPPKGIEMLNAKWSSAQLKHHIFNSEDLSFRADHFKWARQPEKISQLIRSWIS